VNPNQNQEKKKVNKPAEPDLEDSRSSAFFLSISLAQPKVFFFCSSFLLLFGFVWKITEFKNLDLEQTPHPF